jgi:hypothetical protein
MFRSRVEGLDRLSERMARMLDDGALNEALLASGEAVIEAARVNLEDGAPPETRSGALAASLFAELGADGHVRIGTQLDHGWHLEMGTLTRPAFPWLTAALDDQREALVQQVGAWLSVATKRAGRM